MALTLQQLQEKHKDNFQPKKVVSLETAQMEAQTREQTKGNQFQQEEPSGLLGFGKKAFNAIFGGIKLAEGAGKALAAPQVQSQMSEQAQIGSNLELELIKTIEKNKQEGKPTDRLEKALALQQEAQKIIADSQSDFVESLPTNKEVIGSASRLATAAVTPFVAGKLATATGATTAIGTTQGVLRGAAAGATTKAISGAATGAGLGLEQNLSAGGVAMSALGGGTVGALTGGVIGAGTGALVGRANAKVDPDTILANVTPDPKQLTPTEYKRALAQGKITPKTATNPAQYKLDESQKTVALKYQNVIEKDPVKTVNNINDTISSLDNEVGSFLSRNNGIFSRGELRNSLSNALDDVTDITVDQRTLEKAKTTLVNNFIDDLDKNDMTSLWQARKAFDAKIEKAFSGSPTLQKELKVAFRNSVQDFISTKTPDSVYSSYMKDMSNLFRLRDNVALKASKERAESGIQAWLKANPIKAQITGMAIAGATAFGLGKVSGGQSND